MPKKQKCEVWLVCGSPNTLREMGTNAIQYFEFDTEAERDAFVQGADAVSGYSDFATFDSEDSAHDYLVEMTD